MKAELGAAVKLTAELVLLLTVTVCGKLVEPTGVEVKVRPAGDTDVGDNPMPVKGTTCGEFPAPS